MDLAQEEFQFLTITDILKESIRIPKASTKTFSLITLTLIFPLSFAILAHSLFTHPILTQLQDQSVSNPKTHHEWTLLFLFQFSYLIFLFAFSLLSTAAVVFTVASLYTSKPVSFTSTISAIPRVFKRLFITYLYVSLLMIAYNIVFITCLVGLIVAIDTHNPILLFFSLIAIFVLFLVVHVYITALWHLAFGGKNMSSLAAARADNFYYPPEWTPNQGSLNKFHGQHALRERARKLDQGILIIRFEMPFNIWCGGCNSMIAKGVRFNAEKKQVGNYYSTKIWSFTMKSACCKHEIVIQTDPKNCEYVIISGAQRKIEEFDIEDAETFALPADEEKGKLTDPFYRLEHQEGDLQKKKEAEPVLVRLQRVSDSRHSDDYSLNKALRARLRNQKKRIAEEEVVSRKMGLGIRLLPTSEEDSAIAKNMKFSSKFEKNKREKRAAINAAPIFPKPSGSSIKKQSELESKRRKIKAIAASNLLTGRVKPSSSWSSQSVSKTGHKAMAVVAAARRIQ